MIMIVGVAVIILTVGWAQYRNGLFTSCVTLVNVMLAGLVAFNVFEPFADLMDSNFQNTMLVGCEDFIALMMPFCATLFGLRWATNYLTPELLDAHGWLQFFGASAVGLVTGYLLSGFLICAMQTLPLDARFLDFEPRETNEMPYRPIYPADRVWLVMMCHAGDRPLRWKEDTKAELPQSLTFDRAGTFELRYLRHRRTTDGRTLLYQGEFDRELGK